MAKPCGSSPVGALWHAKAECLAGAKLGARSWSEARGRVAAIARGHGKRMGYRRRTGHGERARQGERLGRCGAPGLQAVHAPQGALTAPKKIKHRAWGGIVGADR